MIRIIGVGRVKERALQQSIQEYLRRLQPYQKTAIVEVEDLPAPQDNSPAQNDLVSFRLTR